MSLASSHAKLPIHPVMNESGNAVITEVLTWKIKFSVNGRLFSRKSSPKSYF